MPRKHLPRAAIYMAACIATETDREIRGQKHDNQSSDKTPAGPISARHHQRRFLGQAHPDESRCDLVYCLEEVDNGKALNDIRLPRDAKLTAAMDRSLFDGTVVVRGSALRRKAGRSKPELYSSEAPAFEKARITAIPYRLWAHRAPGEMQVWVRE